MTDLLVSFDVVGNPGAQGSKIQRQAANGTAYMQEAGGSHLRSWRSAVADAARNIAADLDAPLDGPLRLDVTFRFPMPASRPKAVRAAGCAWKISAPDGDKLIRAICDALTAGGLIRDDARIAVGTWRKLETLQWTGATIRLLHPGGIG